MEHRRLKGEGGASLTEYALLVALIGLVCIGAVSFFGGQNGDSLDGSASLISNAN